MISGSIPTPDYKANFKNNINSTLECLNLGYEVFAIEAPKPNLWFWPPDTPDNKYRNFFLADDKNQITNTLTNSGLVEVVPIPEETQKLEVCPAGATAYYRLTEKGRESFNS